MRTTIRVHVPLTLEVDLEDWANEYGLEFTAAAVEEDVRQLVPQVVEAKLQELGLGRVAR